MSDSIVLEILEINNNTINLININNRFIFEKELKMRIGDETTPLNQNRNFYFDSGVKYSIITIKNNSYERFKKCLTDNNVTYKEIVSHNLIIGGITVPAKIYGIETKVIFTPQNSWIEHLKGLNIAGLIGAHIVEELSIKLKIE